MVKPAIPNCVVPSRACHRLSYTRKYGLTRACKPASLPNTQAAKRAGRLGFWSNVRASTSGTGSSSPIRSGCPMHGTRHKMETCDSYSGITLLSFSSFPSPSRPLGAPRRYTGVLGGSDASGRGICRRRARLLPEVETSTRVGVSIHGSSCATNVQPPNRYIPWLGAGSNLPT